MDMVYIHTVRWLYNPIRYLRPAGQATFFLFYTAVIPVYAYAINHFNHFI
jgi:hypothetical protein